MLDDKALQRLERTWGEQEAAIQAKDMDTIHSTGYSESYLQLHEDLRDVLDEVNNLRGEIQALRRKRQVLREMASFIFICVCLGSVAFGIASVALKFSAGLWKENSHVVSPTQQHRP